MADRGGHSAVSVPTPNSVVRRHMFRGTWLLVEAICYSAPFGSTAGPATAGLSRRLEHREPALGAFANFPAVKTGEIQSKLDCVSSGPRFPSGPEPAQSPD